MRNTFLGLGLAITAIAMFAVSPLSARARDGPELPAHMLTGVVNHPGTATVNLHKMHPEFCVASVDITIFNDVIAGVSEITFVASQANDLTKIDKTPIVAKTIRVLSRDSLPMTEAARHKLLASMFMKVPGISCHWS